MTESRSLLNNGHSIATPHDAELSVLHLARRNMLSLRFQSSDSLDVRNTTTLMLSLMKVDLDIDNLEITVPDE